MKDAKGVVLLYALRGDTHFLRWGRRKRISED
jgi:hypothetical protein